MRLRCDSDRIGGVVVMHEGALGVPGIPGSGPMAGLRAAYLAGRPADVLQAAEAVIVTSTDPAEVVEAVTVRAEALAQIGLMADAFSLLQSTRGKETAAGRPGAAAKLSMAESALRMASGDAQAATSALVQAANGFAAAGETANQIRAQLQLAAVYAMTAQQGRVRDLLGRCLTAARQLGDPEVLAEVRHQEGLFLTAAGGNPAPSFEDGLQAADRSANQVVQVQLRVDLGGTLARWDPGRSAGLISAAETIASAVSDPLACANALATVAQGWWALGRAADGVRCSDQALAQLRAVGARVMLIRLAAVTADVCSAAGRPDDARRYLGEAITVGEQVGGPGGAANVMVIVGQAALQRGDQVRALQAFRDAAARLQAARLPVPPQLAAAIGNPGSSA